MGIPSKYASVNPSCILGDIGALIQLNALNINHVSDTVLYITADSKINKVLALEDLAVFVYLHSFIEAGSDKY